MHETVPTERHTLGYVAADPRRRPAAKTSHKYALGLGPSARYRLATLNQAHTSLTRSKTENQAKIIAVRQSDMVTAAYPQIRMILGFSVVLTNWVPRSKAGLNNLER